MDCPPEAGGALQARPLAQELLPVFPWVGVLDGAVEPMPTFAVALSAIALPRGPEPHLHAWNRRDARGLKARTALPG
jgi:hypothetical protein